MLQAICINKTRDTSNKIISYQLKFDNGDIKDIPAQLLKDKILNRELHIRNLKISKNNRLIGNTINRKYYTDDELFKMLAKAKIMGLNITELKMRCGPSCYVIFRPNDIQLLIIPSTITNTTNVNREGGLRSIFANHVDDIQGNLQVIGGSGLTSTREMFSEVKLKSIDFTYFDTFNVTSMELMFDMCRIPIIDVNTFDITNVENMDDMFRGIFCKEIDLRSFNLINNCTVFGMFIHPQYKNIKVRVRDERIIRYNDTFSGINIITD